MRSIIKLILIIESAVVLISCNKEDSDAPEVNSNTILKGTVSATIPATKTHHEYSDKTLKVRWNNGDEVAVSDGKELFKFTQTGSLSDDGHTALFSSENPVSFEDCEIIAVYPYTESLSYDLTNQAGTIDKLFQTDLLLARANITATKVDDLAFQPLCAVIRFPKYIIVTDEDYSGKMQITISGENVGGKVDISKTGGIEVQTEEISIPVTIINGRFAEDVYVVFVPKEKTGSFSYSIKTNRGDDYSFIINNITTTIIYSVKSAFDGFVQFEDDVFKKYCVENYDRNTDGEISYSEARYINKIIIYNTDVNISSLKGIETFKNLTYLYLYPYPNTNKSMNLSTIDVSHNKKLDTLVLHKIQVSELNVKGCSNLKYLYGYRTMLTRLDVSGCSLLETLIFFGNNQLAQIDVSGCSHMKLFNCNGNQLAQLDVSECSSLEELLCEINPLSQLDVSKNTTLKKLECWSCQLSEINVKGCSSLEYLSCFDNQLTQLDVSNKEYLQELMCHNNQLTQLMVSGCTSLDWLCCLNNQLKLLDLNGCTSLRRMDCYDNQLTQLIVKGCSSLERIECYNNQLTHIDFNDNYSLNYFDCDNNKINNLDVSELTSLEYLYCTKNQLTQLDVSKNTSLKILSCYENQILELDVSNNIALTSLNCQSNKLTQLDVSFNTNLLGLKCYYNQLTQLDLSKNLMFYSLYAWPQNCTFSKLWKKKGQTITYRNNENKTINPSDYSTEIIEVD